MTVSRRQALTAGSVVALASAVAPQAMAADTPEALAGLAVLYVLPLIEMYATRRRAEAMGQAGRLLNAPRLADATSRAVTTPNVDTLYSSGWIDLAAGPATIELPPAGLHYFSLALMDAWSNNFVVLPAAKPGTPQRAMLVGPRGLPPADGAAAVIRSPTRHVWLLGRTFAASNDDLTEAHAVQAALKVTGGATPAEPPVDKAALSPDDPVAFFALANRLMGEEGVLPADGAVLARLRAIGVGPGLSFVDTPATRAGAAAAWARLKTGRTQPVGGWSYPRTDLGNFGADYAYRAATALGGLAALPPSDAIYLFAAGDGQGPPGSYSGARPWTLSFPRGQEPPAGAFWSLTLYERTPEGRQYFFPNPANRFAVAGHMPGLKHGADGSLTIHIANEAPSDPMAKANWLPAPKGPFTLVLRLYKPEKRALDGRWRAPALKPA